MAGLVDYHSSDEEQPSIGTTERSGSTAIARDASDHESKPNTGLDNGTSTLAPESFRDVQAISYPEQRLILRNLTLPDDYDYNFDIPASPGAPSIDGVNAKFMHFLRLKSNLVHFNVKMGSSAALKNPALTLRMITATGLDAHLQYESVCSGQNCDWNSLPRWAVGNSLNKIQQAWHEKDKKVSTRKFVSAGISK